MNKKGFTVVELLAVIVIISLIAGIATISYTSFVNAARNRVFDSYVDTMHTDTANYLFREFNKVSSSAQVKISDLPVALKLSDLVNSGVISKINNPSDSSDYCTSTINGEYSRIVVSVNSNSNGPLSLKYEVYLVCKSEKRNKTYID